MATLCSIFSCCNFDANFTSPLCIVMERDLWSSTDHSRHIDFVSGHNGSTFWDVSIAASCGPLTILLRNLAIPWLFPMRIFKNTGFDILLKLTLDYLFTVLPTILAFTVFSDRLSSVLLAILCLICALIFFCFCEYAYSDRPRPVLKEVLSFIPTSDGSGHEGKRYFVTYFRAYIYVATAICILAVDFNVFPRRFAKTETFGYSLMDSGVGLFVVASAMVSPDARRVHYTLPWRHFPRRVLSTWPLLAFGFVRLVSVKSAGYQEHVSEYGVHWNFFFTLAAVKIIVCACSVVLPLHRSAWPLAILHAVGYQYLLSRCGLREILLYGAVREQDRASLFDANREGLLSVLGYLALYYVGIGIGRQIFRMRKQTLRTHASLLTRLSLLAAVVYCTLWACEQYIEGPSRRMANLAYVLWITLLALIHLCAFLLTEIFVLFLMAVKMPLYHSGHDNDRRDPLACLEPCLWQAVNSNGWVYFVLSNLCTGLVNMSVTTLDVDNYSSVIVICLYAFFVSYVIFAMYAHKWIIKL